MLTTLDYNLDITNIVKNHKEFKNFDDAALQRYYQLASEIVLIIS